MSLFQNGFVNNNALIFPRGNYRNISPFPKKHFFEFLDFSFPVRFGYVLPSLTLSLTVPHCENRPKSKRKFHLPTIHFRGRYMLVSGRVPCLEDIHGTMPNFRMGLKPTWLRFHPPLGKRPESRRVGMKPAFLVSLGKEPYVPWKMKATTKIRIFFLDHKSYLKYNDILVAKNV